MTGITLDRATAIANAAIARGGELELAPLTVAGVDPGGHLVTLHRQDGASTMRPQIAVAKAAGALALGMSSRRIAEVAAERPTFFAALAHIAPAGIGPAAGGVIVVDLNDVAIGAIGVTGDTSDNDEICALAGIAAAGLAARS